MELAQLTNNCLLRIEMQREFIRKWKYALHPSILPNSLRMTKGTGTPFRFTESQFGWRNRHTIESIATQSQPASLFEIDPALPVMTTKDMLKALENFK